jgi:hypothetical protein
MCVYMRACAGLLAFNEYGGWPVIKAVAWVCGSIISCLIIASRKHYTVDVVVAWCVSEVMPGVFER